MSLSNLEVLKQSTRSELIWLINIFNCLAIWFLANFNFSFQEWRCDQEKIEHLERPEWISEMTLRPRKNWTCWKAWVLWKIDGLIYAACIYQHIDSVNTCSLYIYICVCLFVCLCDGVKCHFQQYFSHIVVVSFICGVNRRTQNKPRRFASHWQTLSHNKIEHVERPECYGK
jgi:hypothetical protein